VNYSWIVTKNLKGVARVVFFSREWLLSNVVKLATKISMSYLDLILLRDSSQHFEYPHQGEIFKNQILMNL
jgi:hypothetical protein